MLHVFTITDTLDASCRFRQGVPLPKGAFSANTTVKLVNEQQELVSCSCKVLGLWPDRSVRWLLLEGCAKLSTQGPTHFYLQHASYNQLSVKPQWVHNYPGYLKLNLKSSSLTFSKTAFLSVQSEHLLSALDCKLSTRGQTAAQLSKIDTQYEISYDVLHQPLFCDIQQDASLEIESESEQGLNKTLNMSANLRIYYDSGAMELQLTLHNPQPLVHHGGQWDLGNENSLYIDELALNFALKGNQTHNVSAAVALVAPATLGEVSKVAQSFEQLSIVQHSSGGEFWNSPNHKCADNQVHLHKRGASVVFDGQDAQEGQDAHALDVNRLDINRPEPLIEVRSDHQGLIIQPQHFWQKFPSALHANANTHHVSMHYTDPERASELQPGEKLSHKLFCILQGEHTQDDMLLKAANIVIAPALVQAAQVLPWFSLDFTQDPLQKLINQGIEGERNFFKKREALDEFGWRHFGDIYADHEAAQHSGDAPFVSHYNNQYDPLYGFLKQWLLSGEHHWKVLADELFDHLVHIDIYHTDLDKPEYNNGLFWHTDHYLQAETASHRTYSKHQPSDVYQDHAGGGGPGAHHCYTTGLALYYWLSGEQQAFACMLKLNKWMRHIYEGDSTLLGLVLNIKNANYLRIPGSDKLLLGAGTGIVHNIFTDSYPLDRGTGNYVNAILDAYELTQDLQHLDDAERVMLRTFSANDDFALRHFDDIENTWYYVVFLQSVAKYLYFVSQGEQSLATGRAATAQIQAAFVHYIEYICQHERPYLTQKEKLEYPNDTWTAQDLRKVQLLAIGSTFVSGEQKSRFIQKATELNDWIVSRLQTSEERDYTRLLSLMMQNYGALQLLDKSLIDSGVDLGTDSGTDANICPVIEPLTDQVTDSTQANSGDTQHSSLGAKVLSFARDYSVKREIKHLTQRIPKLQKWLGRP